MSVLPRREPIAPRAPGRPPWPGARGFTLVEVLVTAAVTLVAFTGLATIQILALRASSSSLERSQATALAYEIVDRMRLNRGENGLTDTALGGAYDDLTLCNASARHPQDARYCTVDASDEPIGSSYLATDQRALWSAANSYALPHWFAGVIRDQAIFTVSVQWDDTRAQDTASNEVTVTASCLGTTMPASMQEVCVMTQL